MATALLRSKISLATGRTLLSATRPRLVLAHAMATGQPSQNYMLQYKYTPDILEKRGPYRQGHLDAIKDGIAGKKIVIGGAIAEPVDGALLIFEGVSKEEVEEYAKADPYYTAGLIADYTIRAYMRVQ